MHTYLHPCNQRSVEVDFYDGEEPEVMGLTQGQGVNSHCVFTLRASQVAQGKEFACNSGDTGDLGSTPGSGRSLGGGNGSPLQYSCLGNPMGGKT